MPVALITGVAGQDGSYLGEALISAGYDVHGVVRPDSEPVDAGPEFAGVRLHELDLADLDALDRLVQQVEPDEIYSLASISSVFQSWQSPVQTARINALSVAQLLASARELQDRSGRRVKLAHAGSGEIFGDAEVSPQSETTAIAPSSPYGAAKAFAHHLVQVFRAQDVFATNCILYNHESPRRPPNFVTRKITQAAVAIANGEQDTLSLGTLETRRDWGWAPDYVNALRLSLQAEHADDYVIATGVTHSIADFVEAAFAHVGIRDWQDRVVIDKQFARPTDPHELRGDASKAAAELGWSSTVGFDEIVTAMVDHDLSARRSSG
jgi:GDPmannose 4,6-dehydratase